MTARSLAVTNSVSFRMRLSSISCSSSSWALLAKASRFSLRHFALFFCPLVVSLASVSLICFCTSSSLISVFTGFFSFNLGPFGLPLFRDCGFVVGAFFSISIFSLRIRFRFLRSMSVSWDSAVFASAISGFFRSLRCLSLASRSFLFSSFVFFFGRVCWFSAERSIFPTTLIFVVSLGRFSVNISSSFVSSFIWMGSSSSSSSEFSSISFSEVRFSSSSSIFAVWGSSVISGSFIEICSSSWISFSISLWSCTGSSVTVFSSLSVTVSSGSSFLGATGRYRLSKSIFPTCFILGFNSSSIVVAISVFPDSLSDAGSS